MSTGKVSKANPQVVLNIVDGESKYEISEFVSRHFNGGNSKDFKGVKYEPSELIGLLNAVISLLKTEKTLVKIDAPATIVGDLNGHFQDLIRIFNIKTDEEDKDETKFAFICEKFVFLGDYTDYSEHNLETVCLVFALKLLYDTRYVLLRGHQEIFTGTEFEVLVQIYPKRPGSELK
uniref:SER_THR_PHOSPHATASE domain-containing protein n=1 Tax=Caenorhabditis japonica TaxID=281687 RepID=A0A8R1HQT2_CAEJA